MRAAIALYHWINGSNFRASKYLKLVDKLFKLLGQEVSEDAPLPPSMFQDMPAPNSGDLSDESEQRLSIAICRLTSGMNSERWQAMGQEERIPWIKEAIRCLNPLTVTYADLEQITLRRLAAKTMQNAKDKPTPVYAKKGHTNRFLYADCVKWFERHPNWEPLPKDENEARSRLSSA